MNILNRKTNSSTDYWLKQIIKLSIILKWITFITAHNKTKQKNPHSYVTNVVCWNPNLDKYFYWQFIMKLNCSHELKTV